MSNFRDFAQRGLLQPTVIITKNSRIQIKSKSRKIGLFRSSQRAKGTVSSLRSHVPSMSLVSTVESLP